MAGADCCSGLLSAGVEVVVVSHVMAGEGRLQTCPCEPVACGGRALARAIGRESDATGRDGCDMSGVGSTELDDE